MVYFNLEKLVVEKLGFVLSLATLIPTVSGLVSLVKKLTLFIFSTAVFEELVVKVGQGLLPGQTLHCSTDPLHSWVLPLLIILGIVCVYLCV